MFTTQLLYEIINYEAKKSKFQTFGLRQAKPYLAHIQKLPAHL